MKVGKVRSAIEGLDDDAEVVLWINSDEPIGHFEEPAFKLDDIARSAGGHGYLDVFLSVFDAGDLDEDESDGD